MRTMQGKEVETWMVNRGDADKDRIGVQGQAGRGTPDCISGTQPIRSALCRRKLGRKYDKCYGGIRWESGMACMFQTQVWAEQDRGNALQDPLNFIVRTLHCSLLQKLHSAAYPSQRRCGWCCSMVSGNSSISSASPSLGKPWWLTTTMSRITL